MGEVRQFKKETDDQPRAKLGGAFILDQPRTIPAVWGEGPHVIWPEGEPLMIAGPPGVGKSNIAEQIVMRLCHVNKEPLLGYPVRKNVKPLRRVMYLALDRPRQIGRSMRRMVAEDHRGNLNKLLRVFDQTPPVNPSTNSAQFVRWVKAQCPQCGYLMIDSLYNLIPGLSTDEGASAVSQLVREVVTAGIEVVVLHHDRKTLGGDARQSPGLDDIYGGRWLTAGMGSVVMLAGKAGDQEVVWHHVKPPAESVGPMAVVYDRTTGGVEKGDREIGDREDRWADEIAVIVAGEPGINSTAAKNEMKTTKNTDEREKGLKRAVHKGLVHRRTKGRAKLLHPGPGPVAELDYDG